MCEKCDGYVTERKFLVRTADDPTLAAATAELDGIVKRAEEQAKFHLKALDQIKEKSSAEAKVAKDRIKARMRELGKWTDYEETHSGGMSVDTDDGVVYAMPIQDGLPDFLKKFFK
jgi:hypothetical protein